MSFSLCWSDSVDVRLIAFILVDTVIDRFVDEGDALIGPVVVVKTVAAKFRTLLDKTVQCLLGRVWHNLSVRLDTIPVFDSRH